MRWDSRGGRSPERISQRGPAQNASSPLAFARRLSSLALIRDLAVADDPARRARLGAAGPPFVEARHSRRASGARLVGLLEPLMIILMAVIIGFIVIVFVYVPQVEILQEIFKDR